MIPLYDRRGRAVGFQHGPWLLNPQGAPVAVAEKSGVVRNSRGACIGWWRNGHLRGLDGGVMLFVRGARNVGVMLPIASEPPRLPTFIEPVTPWITKPAPERPSDMLGWSRTVFGEW